MPAFDAAEIKQEARKLAAQHEQLHERVSRAIGPVANYDEMTSPELAAYALKKMGIEVPEDDTHPAVSMLNGYLHGRNDHASGSATDAADMPAFLDKYLNT